MENNGMRKMERGEGDVWHIYIYTQKEQDKEKDRQVEIERVLERGRERKGVREEEIEKARVKWENNKKSTYVEP